jgi:spermidine synthase
VDGPLIEGSNNPGDEATTHILSFLPAAFSRSPSSALVIGLGTGTTTKAMLSLPVKSVTTVEINPSMRRAADFFVGSSLNDPRWHYEQTDARQFMSADAKRYDVISSEPSWPVASTVSQLFTLEFFQLAKSRLQPGGVFCQWVPQYLVPKDDFVMLFRTFRTVFPGAQVWAMEDDFGQPGDLFLVGVEGGSYADSATVAAAVGDELAKSGVKGVRVKRAFSSGQLDADASQPGPLNTDDKPLLEFHVPWALVSHAVERIRGAK